MGSIKKILFLIVYLIPFILIGMLTFALQGVVGAFGLSVGILVLIALGNEKRMKRHYRAVRLNDLKFLDQLGTFKLYSIPSSKKQINVSRALFGRGSLFISQGFIISCTEEELITMVLELKEQLKQGHLIFNGTIDYLVNLAQGKHSYSPISVLKQLVFHPFIRFLKWSRV